MDYVLSLSDCQATELSVSDNRIIGIAINHDVCWDYSVEMVGKILRKIVKDSRLGWRGYAEKCGLNPSTFNNLFKLVEWGDTKPTTIEGLASGMGMSVEEFLLEIERRRQPRPFIVHDVDPADTPREGIKYMMKTEAGPGGTYRLEDYQHGILEDKYLPTSIVPFPAWGLAAMIVEGTSMLPLFKPGDTIIVAKNRQRIRTDDFAVVGFRDGSHQLKKIRVIDNQTWELIPLNKEDGFEPFIITSEQIAWFVPVVAHIRALFLHRTPGWDKTG